MIKGIDAQIMMQRATDYAKIAADKISNVEHEKEFAQKLEQERAARMQESINDVEKVLNKRVRREKDDEGQHPNNKNNHTFHNQDNDVYEEEEADIFNTKNEILPDRKLKVMPSKDLGVEIDIDV